MIREGLGAFRRDEVSAIAAAKRLGMGRTRFHELDAGNLRAAEEFLPFVVVGHGGLEASRARPSPLRRSCGELGHGNLKELSGEPVSQKAGE